MENIQETLSLDIESQKVFEEKIKTFKKERLQKDGMVPGVIIIRHIPQGFYEKQMKGYFSQFGRVTRLRLARSKKTGGSRNFAFIEFECDEVAKIAADTMNNYLMFGKLMKCEFVPPENVKSSFFRGWHKGHMLSYVRHMKEQNKPKTDEKLAENWLRRLKKLEMAKKKMAQIGINFDFNVKPPELLLKNKSQKEQEVVTAKSSPKTKKTTEKKSIEKASKSSSETLLIEEISEDSFDQDMSTKANNKELSKAKRSTTNKKLTNQTLSKTSTVLHKEISCDSQPDTLKNKKKTKQLSEETKANDRKVKNEVNRALSKTLPITLGTDGSSDEDLDLSNVHENKVKVERSPKAKRDVVSKKLTKETLSKTLTAINCTEGSSELPTNLKNQRESLIKDKKAKEKKLTNETMNMPLLKGQHYIIDFPSSSDEMDVSVIPKKEKGSPLAKAKRNTTNKKVTNETANWPLLKISPINDSEDFFDNVQAVLHKAKSNPTSKRLTDETMNRSLSKTSPITIHSKDSSVKKKIQQLSSAKQTLPVTFHSESDSLKQSGMITSEGQSENSERKKTTNSISKKQCQKGTLVGSKEMNIAVSEKENGNIEQPSNSSKISMSGKKRKSNNIFQIILNDSSESKLQNENQASPLIQTRLDVHDKENLTGSSKKLVSAKKRKSSEAERIELNDYRGIINDSSHSRFPKQQGESLPIQIDNNNLEVNDSVVSQLSLFDHTPSLSGKTSTPMNSIQRFVMGNTPCILEIDPYEEEITFKTPPFTIKVLKNNRNVEEQKALTFGKPAIPRKIHRVMKASAKAKPRCRSLSGKWKICEK